MICNNCAALLQGEMNFCPHCGMRQPKPTTTPVLKPELTGTLSSEPEQADVPTEPCFIIENDRVVDVG